MGAKLTCSPLLGKTCSTDVAAELMQPFLTRQDALEGMTAQQELMKQLVSALAEVERGKQAGLNNFLNEYGARIAGRPSKEDYARVKAEVYFVLLVYFQNPFVFAPCPPRIAGLTSKEDYTRVEAEVTAETLAPGSLPLSANTTCSPHSPHCVAQAPIPAALMLRSLRGSLGTRAFTCSHETCSRAGAVTT